ncbi:MAG: 16S rRNA (cytosine(967)-C(5))-methyltransferase RsmB [Clostridia bacterium]|nr:16S rRNA (cytosine(967)-C(5))-methyltransferase RsmB [Clostridia bacterium]
MKTARQIAFEALNKIERDKSYSNLTLDSVLYAANLSKADNSLVSALVYGVLERTLTIDYCLSRQLKQPLKKLKPQVLTALRLGTYQLLFMDKIPQSAAVNESVTLVKKNGCAFAAGLTNAVLRAVARDGLVLPDEEDIIHFYSIKYSFPEWLIKLWVESYGAENAVGIMESCAGRPPLTVRVNTLKTTKEKLVSFLADDGVTALSVNNIDNALNLEKCGSIENLSAFNSGLFHVQDGASQLCAAALDAKPGDTVLDLCSAPGGKAFTCAEKMENNGRIIACDIHSHRLALIKEGANRLGINIIDVKRCDASHFCEDMPQADRVLCDVPCSGLGIVRRKPEIRFKAAQEIEKLPEIQYSILTNAARYVKKGGRLIYSTCALNPKENEEVCAKFLRENSNFEIVDISSVAPGAYTKNKTVTLMPHITQTDGFFIAAFERRI